MSYIRLGEAASHANCCTRTVRRAIKTGDLKGYKCGGKWLVKPAELREWIERDPGGPSAASEAAREARRPKAVPSKRSRRPSTLERVKNLRTAA